MRLNFTTPILQQVNSYLLIFYFSGLAFGLSILLIANIMEHLLLEHANRFRLWHDIIIRHYNKQYRNLAPRARMAVKAS
jgi:hypothetical protein